VLMRGCVGMAWVFVDVDGTLCPDVVQWCEAKFAAGDRLVLWSARGREHAVRRARELGCEALFFTIVGKPSTLIDDKGWSWIRYCETITTGWGTMRHS